MLDVIGAAPGSQNTIDWPQVWRESPEKARIKLRLAEMKNELSSKPVNDTPDSLKEYAASFTNQFYIVTKRIFEQYWRTPSYLYSKTLLCAGSVSQSPRCVLPKSCANIAPVTFHWLLLLEVPYQSTRPPKSALRHLHAYDHLRQHCTANNAALRRAAGLVRSP
jgi:hypothetical protein